MYRFIENYNEQAYDVLIIGGGITGASIAYEAASRGLKTALIEKNDFASATSSATSRMIHGGLRYLATGEIHLVRESLRERRILMNIAPNFVRPQPFLFAVYDYFSTPKILINTGMIAYEILSYDKKLVRDKNNLIPHFSHLSSQRIKTEIPAINTQGLKGGFLYYDCRNHSPERLTLAFIKSAIRHGAHIANYTEMTSFIYKKEQGKIKISGVKVLDRLNHKTHNIYASLVINASGPWADIILSKIQDKKEIKHIRRSEGIHIVINKPLINKYIFASQDTNGEHFFIIPFRRHTIIGTTDKEFKGNPDNYTITEQSVKELLNKVNSGLKPENKISTDEIVFIYGGLRPLVENQTKQVYNASRKYEITDHSTCGIDGLISVEGGKYTTSRRLAQRVIDKAFIKLGKKLIKSSSAKKFLSTSNIPDIEHFITIKTSQYPHFSPEQIRYLVYSYGTEIDMLMSLYYSNKKLQITFNQDGENLAQVVYAIRYEMARSLNDILLRRTGIAWLGYPADQTVYAIAAVAQKELGWSDAKTQHEIDMVKEKFRLVNSLKNNCHEKQQLSA